MHTSKLSSTILENSIISIKEWTNIILQASLLSPLPSSIYNLLAASHGQFSSCAIFFSLIIHNPRLSAESNGYLL